MEAQQLQKVGYYVMELTLPAVLAVSNEINTPRLAPLRGILRASKEEIPVWTVASIEADPQRIGTAGSRTSIVELSIPSHEGVCEFISGDTVEEAAFSLVDRLRHEKVL